MAKNSPATTAEYYKKFIDAQAARLRHEQWWRVATQHYYSRNPASLRNIYFFNIFVPYTYTIVESITARTVQEVYSTYPFLTVRPRYGSRDEELAQAIETLLLWVFENDDFNFIGALQAVVREAVLYGTGIFGITEIPAFDGQTTYYMPRLVWVPITEFYVDPRAVSLADAEYVIRRQFLPREEVERLAKAHDWKIPKEALDAGTVATSISEWNRILGLEEQTAPLPTGTVELWQVLTPERIDYVVSRLWPIASYDLPLGRAQWPYVEVRWSGLPTSFWGVGVGRAIAGIQRDLNILRMQRRHNVHMSLNKMFVGLYGAVRAGAHDRIVARPGAILWETQPGALRELQFTDVTGSAYNEEMLLTRDLQLAAGEQDYNLGIAPQRSRERAMTVIRIQEAGLTRFSAFVRYLGSVTFRSLVKKIIVMLRQRLPRTVFLRIVENEAGFYDKTPMELLQMFDYVPYVGVDTRAKETKLLTLIQAMPVLMQLPNIRRDWLAQRLLRLLGMDDWKSAIISDEELAARAQALAAEQAIQQGGR